MIVAIVGSPNVGKSTLFNRFIGERKAVVDDMPGVTRDRNYAEVAWNRRVFTLVDTGGYVPPSGEDLPDAVSEQVEQAISSCDVILFMVDVQTGPTNIAATLAKVILKGDKPYILIANKVDRDIDVAEASPFYALGMGDPVAISAANGRSSGDLLDQIISYFPEGEENREEKPELPKLAVVGRPNVGKSTFVNSLAGNNRLVVSKIPGTTRDAIDLPMKRDGRDFLLIDTAGLRRKSKITEQVEYYSSLRTSTSLSRCDVAILLVETIEGMTVQDVKIAEQAYTLGKGLVICVNKWDSIEKDSNTSEYHRLEIMKRFPFLASYPIIFTSGLTGQRTWRAIDTALEVQERRGRRISTQDLNDFLANLNETTDPPTKRGRAMRMSYCVQPKSNPPTILFFTVRPKDVPDHYRRFLENRLRSKFDFLGTPIRVVFKQK
ncbi:MAG: ribosome biogenesis GTPase Der [Candidatus Latescibacterota bacterium]|nr:ribosome biogenesis GTPase Der [Candidatus Latescibacterota bacterium]